jgi:AraC-like DNA-binding protein
LPETSLVAAIRFKGAVVQNGAAPVPSTVVSGLQSRTRTLTHSDDCFVALVLFTETGGSAFVRQPLDELFNSMIPMDCMVSASELALVQEQLAEMSYPAQRALILEQFLVKQLRDYTLDRLMASVVARIKQANGVLRMDKLARESGLSVSAFERRFRRVVGTSPKKYASVVRLRYVTGRWAGGENLSQLAHEAGYCDQSHFIKDLKKFIGRPPASFFG